RRGQLDGRPAETDQFAQVPRPNVTAGENTDRRDVRPDRVQVVLYRRLRQRTRTVRVDCDSRGAEFGGPAAVGAPVNHRAIIDAVGGDNDRAGNLDFLLVEWRGHQALLVWRGICEKPQIE